MFVAEGRGDTVGRADDVTTDINELGTATIPVLDVGAGAELFVAPPTAANKFVCAPLVKPYWWLSAYQPEKQEFEVGDTQYGGSYVPCGLLFRSFWNQ